MFLFQFLFHFCRCLLLSKVGRPPLLTPSEELLVLRFVEGVRRRGGVVDVETLILIAKEIVQVERGEGAPLPALDHVQGISFFSFIF